MSRLGRRVVVAVFGVLVTVVASVPPSHAAVEEFVRSSESARAHLQRCQHRHKPVQHPTLGHPVHNRTRMLQACKAELEDLLNVELTLKDMISLIRSDTPVRYGRPVKMRFDWPGETRAMVSFDKVHGRIVDGERVEVVSHVRRRLAIQRRDDYQLFLWEPRSMRVEVVPDDGAGSLVQRYLATVMLLLPHFAVDTRGQIRHVFGTSELRERAREEHGRLGEKLDGLFSDEELAQLLDYVEDLLTREQLGRRISRLWGLMVAQWHEMDLRQHEIATVGREVLLGSGMPLKLANHYVLGDVVPCSARDDDLRRECFMLSMVSEMDKTQTKNAVRYEHDYQVVLEPGTLIPEHFEERRMTEYQGQNEREDEYLVVTFDYDAGTSPAIPVR